MYKPKFYAAAAILLLAALLSACSTGSKQREPERPNIIFIMSDDHAEAAVSAYSDKLIHTPNLDRIGKEGMIFRNCFVTNSLCSPSRATILTGQYSYRTGARDNSFSMQLNPGITTFPMLLRQAGYQTALVGKWHLRTKPEGFDYSSILNDQGQYYNPDFITGADTARVHGYVTNIIMDKAIGWLSAQRDDSKPFCLMIHNKAPHRNWLPDSADLDAFEKDLPLPESLYDDYTGRGRAAHEQMMNIGKNLHLLSDLKVNAASKGPKGNWLIGEFNRMDSAQRNRLIRFYMSRDAAVDTVKMTPRERIAWRYQRYIKDYLRCIRAVDRNVGRLLAYLKEKGLMDNTLIVYTSDQGFYLGEHGWFDKRFMYEESLHTPLMMRYPPLIKAGSVSDAPVMNLDLPETFLDLAKVQIPDSMQGASLKPLLAGKTPDNWRKGIYYHYYEYPGWHAVKRHFGIRTQRYKLIHFYYDVDEWELYDLEKDPHEMLNVYKDPAYSAVKDTLTQELYRLQHQYGDSYELAEKILQHDKTMFNRYKNIY
ncbi:sulfatase [Compostibacter hankyongensis]|uniref:Sulfatase n=1 Tax=Compostibacter hankyongensis TaxID=1007089 RepID=A0ABP8G1T1_9BACT